MSNDLTFGVKITSTGDGSALKDARDIKIELVDITKAAGGARGANEELSNATRKTAGEHQNLTMELFKAAAAAGAYKSVIMDSIAASNEYTAAIMGLASVARFSGEDINATLNKANTLTADGLLSVHEAALALKNLLSRGFTADQAIEMINRLKDSAAFGKQASLQFGEAVVSATEGLKNENSILVDNAGVTKNVSVMWKEYADSIGVGVLNLTQAQKRQAEYNGILRETEGQMGNAALAADSLIGAQARMRKATNDAAIAFGQSLTPAATELANAISWTSENAIKPMIFGIEYLGIVASTVTSKIGVMFDYFSHPLEWGGDKGYEEHLKKLAALGELGDQMATELAAKINGAVEAPNIGKDTGARRKDVITPTDNSELLKSAKKFDEDTLASHMDALTKWSVGWQKIEDDLVAIGAAGAAARASHEDAFWAHISGLNDASVAAAEAAANKQTEMLTGKAQEKFAALHQMAEAAGMTEMERMNVARDKELADLERSRMITATDHDLTLQELESFEQAKADIIAKYQQQNWGVQKEVGEMIFAFEKGNNENRFDATVGYLTRLSAFNASSSRASFELNKAASTASAIVHTYSGAMAAFDKAGGGASGAAAAAASILYGLAQVAAIQSTKFGGGAPSAGGGGVPSQATSPGTPVSVQPQQDQQQVVQVTIYNTGNVQSAEFADQMVTQIRDQISNSDVILIDPRSRQAAMLQTAPA